MKKFLSYILALAMTTAIMNGIEFPQKTILLNACTTNEECAEQLAEIEKQKQALQNTLNDSKYDENNLMEQVFAYSDQVQLIEEELAIIESTIHVIQEEVDILSAQLAEKDDIVKERLIKRQQQNNNNTFFALLSSATSVSDLINKWTALNTLQAYDQVLMREFYQDKQQQLLLREEQEVKKQDIEKKKEEAVTAKVEREKALDEIRAKIIDKENIMNSLVTTESDLQAQQDLLNLPVPDEKPKPNPTPQPEKPAETDNNIEPEPEQPKPEQPAPAPSEWQLPVGSGGVVTSYYKSQNYYNEFNSWHLGIDVANNKYSPIYAAAKGRVLFADKFCVEGDKSCNGAFGNLVAISHKNINGMPYVTVYAHMEDVYPNVGDYVYGGDQIGTMGNTGGSYGAHLHMEVHQNTELVYWDRGTRDRISIDPLSVLPWENVWSVRWGA